MEAIILAIVLAQAELAPPPPPPPVASRRLIKPPNMAVHPKNDARTTCEKVPDAPMCKGQ